jgi:hypothetical protein
LKEANRLQRRGGRRRNIDGKSNQNLENNAIGKPVSLRSDRYKQKNNIHKHRKEKES